MARAAHSAAGDTLVFLADIAAVDDARLARYAPWLGEQELARHERFVRAERRRQFIAGRALLRLGLVRLLGIDPETVALRERPGQAPALLDRLSDETWFSISHSGPWIGCAVSTAGAVGFDIERIDAARDVLALAEQAFDSAAVAELQAVQGDARVAAFYRMWCAHEARIKLGADVGMLYPYSLPGLAGALACAHDAGAPPVTAFVDLGTE